MKLIFDPPKRLANLDKHGLDLEAVTDRFFETALVQVAKEGRFKAIGTIEGKAVALIFKPLGTEAFALISLRAASRNERSIL